MSDKPTLESLQEVGKSAHHRIDGNSAEIDKLRPVVHNLNTNAQTHKLKFEIIETKVNDISDQLNSLILEVSTHKKDHVIDFSFIKNLRSMLSKIRSGLLLSALTIGMLGIIGIVANTLVKNVK